MANQFQEQAILSTTKVASIKIYRARLLDDIIGMAIPIDDAGSRTVNVPFDIDDLEVSDQDITKDTGEEKTADYIRNMSRLLNGLNWQNNGTVAWRGLLRKYSLGLKRIIVQKITELGPNIEDRFKIFDITEFTAIRNIRRGLDFNSSATLDLSMPKFRDQNGLNIDLPRENDVVEIIFQYTGQETTERIFIGVISGITYTEEARKITAMTLECFGTGKWLFTNKMVVDRAVVSQFSEGELVKPGLSVYETGAFGNSSIDQIFTFIMMSQLAMTLKSGGLKVTNATGSTDMAARASLIGAVLDSKLAQYEASARTLAKSLTEIRHDPEVTVTHYEVLGGILSKIKDLRLEGGGTDLDPTAEHFDSSVDHIVDGILKDQNRYVEAANAMKPVETALPNAQTDANAYMRAQLSIIMIRNLKTRNTENLQVAKQASLDALRESGGEEGRAPTVIAPFKFDIDVFTSETAFQLIYLPFLTMALYRTWMGDEVAIYRGKQAFAFDNLIRSSFRLFFCSLGTPEDTLNILRNKAKYMVYENERGQIIMELPRYNDFGEDTLDKGEDIDDFIVNNPINLTVSREDMNMIARMDVQMFFSYLGNVGTEDRAGTMVTWHYTDSAVLSKYGMRAEAPIYNPNARDSFSAAAFAALEVIDKNAKTRTMKVTADGSRTFKVGRTYFINRQTLNKMMGHAPTQTRTGKNAKKAYIGKRVDGYIGYLTTDEISIVPGQNIIHTLSFTHVRKARLVTRKGKQQANFKVLPDLSGVIRALEERVISGELSIDISNQDDNAPQIQGTAKIIQVTTFGAMYVTPMRWNEDSARGAHEAFSSNALGLIPPYKAPPTPPPDDYKDWFSVIRQENVDFGLSEGVIRGTHLVDLRLRSFNTAFAAIRSEAQTDMSPASLKYNAVDAVFIPSIKSNDTFFLNNLEGFHVSILKPGRLPSEYIKRVTIVEDNLNIRDTPLGRDFWTPSTWWSGDKGRVFGLRVMGKCIRVVGSRTGSTWNKATKDVFTIIRVDPPSLLRDKSIQIQHPGSPEESYQVELYTGSSVSSNSFKQNVKDTYGSSIPDLDAQFEAAIADTRGSESDAIFMPIILHASIVGNPEYNLAGQALANGCAVNTPLSVIFLAGSYQRLSGDLLPGQQNLSPDGASQLKKEHANGQAVDLTMVPFYADTGWILKDKWGNQPNEYILGQSYRNGVFMASNMLRTLRSRDNVPYEEYAAQNLRVTPKAPTNSTNFVLDTLLSKTDGAMTTVDLTEVDKHFYHVSEAPPEPKPITVGLTRHPTGGA
jgi:hypothetical protein